jgi:hypothetical protein
MVAPLTSTRPLLVMARTLCLRLRMRYRATQSTPSLNAHLRIVSPVPERIHRRPVQTSRRMVLVGSMRSWIGTHELVSMSKSQRRRQSDFRRAFGNTGPRHPLQANQPQLAQTPSAARAVTYRIRSDDGALRCTRSDRTHAGRVTRRRLIRTWLWNVLVGIVVT